MAYIYKITNDINDKVYIGKTEFSIEKRFKEHCNDSKRERYEKRPLYNAMNKYGIEHFHIEMVEETDTPEEREVYWINYYNSYENGYNATLGGDGKKYLDWNLVIKVYENLKNQKEVAKKLNINPDTVHDILIQRNIVINRTFKNKIVNMYDENNNFIQTFSSSQEAALFLINNKITNGKSKSVSSHIREVCSGKRKRAYGFKWKYAN